MIKNKTKKYKIILLAAFLFGVLILPVSNYQAFALSTTTPSVNKTAPKKLLQREK